MSSLRVFLTVLACLGVGLLGCDKVADEAKGGMADKAAEKMVEAAVERAMESESGGEVDADITEDGLTITSKDGDMTVATGSGAKVPDGFPKDVMVYEGATIATSMKQGNQFILNLATDDDAAKVVEAYKSKMKESGWEEKRVMEFGPQTMMSYAKGETKAQVNVAKGDDNTVITLMVEAAKE